MNWTFLSFTFTFFFPLFVFAQHSVPLWSRATGELEISFFEHTFDNKGKSTALEIGFGLGSENLLTTDTVFNSTTVFVGLEKRNVELHLSGGWNSKEQGALFGGEITVSLGDFELLGHAEALQIKEGDQENILGHGLGRLSYQNVLPYGISPYMEFEFAREEEYTFVAGGPGLSLHIGNTFLSWSLLWGNIQWLKNSSSRTPVIIPVFRVHAHFHLLE